MPAVIAIDVLGTPAPKGSARAIMRGGRAVSVPSGSNVNRDKLKSWDVCVRYQAVEAIVALGEAAPTGPLFVEVPVRVAITFRMQRPGSHWAKRGGLKPSAAALPSTKPDIDKLARATLDSLTGLIFDDDSRVAELVLRKVYAEPGREGAFIEVGAL